MRRLAVVVACLAGVLTPVGAQNQRPPASTTSPQGILTAEVDRARAFGDEGHADSALAILTSIATRHPTIPRETIARRITVDLTRYRLVGRSAPPIEAPHWLNARPGTRQMVAPMGQVTLIHFTAHWCGPCRPSYAVIDSVVARFGKAVQVMVVTELYGQFGGRPAKAAAELAADSAYFAEVLRARVPIAIADQPPPPIIPGDYGTVNTSRYGVEPLPQIVVTDRQGVVRRIFVGGDTAQPDRVVDVVGALLAGSR